MCFNVLSIPSRSFHVASAVPLRHWRKFRRIPGLLLRQVDCYVTCYVTGAVGLRLRLRVMAILVKTVAVGESYRPVLSAGVIAADVRHLLSPSGTRGLSNCRCCMRYYVREGDLGMWPAAYLTRAVRGRYCPIFIGTTIAVYVPWLVLPSIMSYFSCFKGSALKKSFPF